MNESIKNEIINQILLEVCSHKKISDGIVNFDLQEHIDVLIEVLGRTSINEKIVKQITNSINEGRFPERQAFTENGYLVTFPTPEHKKRALETGNYSEKDPTNGKGGMHLVKKVEPDSTPTNTQNVEKPVVNPTQQQKSTSTSSSSTSQPTQTSTPSPTANVSTHKPTKIKTTHSSPSSQPINHPQKTSGGATEYSTGIPDDPSTDLDLDKISDYRDPSLEWAHNRKWEKRDNNNYYDDSGNLKAITGLDGTVIPVVEEERISLKKFIEDKLKEKLGIQPTEEPREKEESPT